MRLRKWMTALLSLTLVFTILAGCSKPATTPEPSTPDPAPVKKEEPQFTGPVKLTVWVVGSENVLRMYNEIIAPFKAANPNFEIDVVLNSWGELDKKLVTAFASDSAPDIFLHGQAATATYASQDMLLPIDNYLAKWNETADFYPKAIDAGRYEGKAYSLPVAGSNRLLYYRKDLLAEAGLERAPETFEELMAYAQKLTKRDGAGKVLQGGFFVPTKGQNIQQWWMQFTYAMGGQVFDASGKPIFNNKAGQDALQLIKDIVVKHKMQDYATEPAPGEPPGIVTGRIAMQIDGPTLLGQIDKADPEARKNIGVAAPPKGPNGEPSAFGSYQGMFITKASKNPDAAWHLIKHIGSVESQTILLEAFMGSRKGLLEVGKVKNDPHLQMFYTGLEHMVANPNVVGWPSMRDAIIKQLEAAVEDKVTVQAALNAAAAEVERLVQENKK